MIVCGSCVWCVACIVCRLGVPCGCVVRVACAACVLCTVCVVSVVCFVARVVLCNTGSRWCGVGSVAGGGCGVGRVVAVCILRVAFGACSGVGVVVVVACFTSVVVVGVVVGACLLGCVIDCVFACLVA